MLIVPLLAHAYGGKASTGILLPMLLIGDVFAVRYYNRHAIWRFIWLTLPPAVVGVLLATWVGQYIDDAAFKKAISIIVLGSLALLIYLER
ncbi:MAG: sulfite exporter TauE/SafE family protein, partial [Bacteroidota bacterium]